LDRVFSEESSELADGFRPFAIGKTCAKPPALPLPPTKTATQF
jgi:hypothetical protein